MKVFTKSHPTRTRKDCEGFHVGDCEKTHIVDANSAWDWKSVRIARIRLVAMNAHGMKVAVRAASLGEDLRNLAPLAQRWLFKGLQLDLRLGELDLAELSATGQRDVRHILARHELELASVRLALPHEGLAGSDAGQILWTTERALKAAAGVAAKMVCVDLGRLPAVKPESKPKPPAPAQAGLILIPEPAGVVEVSADEPVDERELQRWEAVDTVLRELGVLADRYRTVLALSSELSSFASLKRGIEQAA